MSKIRLFAVLCVAFVFAPGTSAQGPKVAGKPADLRVQVDLKNGSSIVGIVTAGALVERPGKTGYEPTDDQSDRRSGIRIFYYRNQDGFLFLPYRDIKDVAVLGPLTPEESRTLREAVAHTELVTRNQSAVARKSKAAADAAKADAASETAGRALLERFPPEQGYSKQRYGELRRRELVNRETLSKDEQAFVASFEAWQKAFAAAEPSAESARGAKSEDAPGDARKAAGALANPSSPPKPGRGAPLPKAPRKLSPKAPPVRAAPIPVPPADEAPPIPVPDLGGGAP